MDIDGIAVLVAGGASGLGAATARRLAAAGARVAILDRDTAAGARVAAETAGLFLPVDVCDEADVAAAIVAAEAAHGAARVLVNCAGIAPFGPTIGTDGSPHPLAAFRHALEINLVGTFNMLAQFAARLARAAPIGEERGVIVNTASIAAFEGLAGQAAYAASKSAIVGLTLPVARDLAVHRIRIVTIAPGVFQTPMVSGLAQDLQDGLAAQIPHPSRLGRPDEYARLVESVIANPMLNGTVIRLDGAHRLA